MSLLILLEGTVSVEEWFGGDPADSDPSLPGSTLLVRTSTAHAQCSFKLHMMLLEAAHQVFALLPEYAGSTITFACGLSRVPSRRE